MNEFGQEFVQLEYIGQRDREHFWRDPALLLIKRSKVIVVYEQDGGVWIEVDSYYRYVTDLQIAGTFEEVLAHIGSELHRFIIVRSEPGRRLAVRPQAIEWIAVSRTTGKTRLSWDSQRGCDGMDETDDATLIVERIKQAMGGGYE